MKLILIFSLLIGQVWATGSQQPMNMKGRVRLSLWYDGIEYSPKNEKLSKGIQVYPKQKRLPEEVLIPLMQMPI